MSYAPGGIAGHERDRQVGDDGFEQGLLLEQGLGKFLSVADVPQEFDRAIGYAVGIANQSRGRADPDKAAVLAQIALFQIDELNLAVP